MTDVTLPRELVERLIRVAIDASPSLSQDDVDTIAAARSALTQQAEVADLPCLGYECVKAATCGRAQRYEAAEPGDVYAHACTAGTFDRATPPSPPAQPLPHVRPLDELMAEVAALRAEQRKRMDEDCGRPAQPSGQVLTEKDGACKEADGCPTERAVLQRVWRNARNSLAEQRERVKLQDGPWWRGYESALHWMARDAFGDDAARVEQPAIESATLAKIGVK